MPLDVVDTARLPLQCSRCGRRIGPGERFAHREVCPGAWSVLCSECAGLEPRTPPPACHAMGAGPVLERMLRGKRK